MTEESNHHGPDPAWLRGMTQQRFTRRQMLRYSGAAVGSISMASILAACAGGSSTPAGGASVDFNAEPLPEINFSNWPLYMDKAKDKATGERYSPSLRAFEEQSGLKVNYNDEINENASFFGELQPQFEAGQDTGRDIIVMSVGVELTTILARGWATELDPTLRPNFDANAAAWAKDPFFDEGNRFTMPWQSGITSIGYNTEMVNGTITKMDDLLDSNITGVGKVGILRQDAPDFVMINLGIDPLTSTPDDWHEAAAWLTMLRDSDSFRQAYDQGYVDDLTAGNLSTVLGWSGDVLYYKIWEDYPFEFIVPEAGASLFIDNMLIPAHSANPQGAYKLMDYYYDPVPAQMVTEFVLYMTPVPAVQDLILQHGEETDDPALIATAEDPYLWPDEALLDKVSLGRQLTTDDEVEEWNATFNAVWGS